MIEHTDSPFKLRVIVLSASLVVVDVCSTLTDTTKAVRVAA